MAKRLERRELPDGVAVFDFGTGGLDLAYEVMRGYDALVLVDVSRQGGEPGTLYVMEPDQEDIDAGHRGRRDDRPARHGPADRAALREGRRRLAGQGASSWPASRGEWRRWAWASPTRWRARWTARSSVVLEHGRGAAVHELSLSSAILDTVLRHAEGRKVNAVELTVGALRQVVPDVAGVLLGDRRARHASARARGSS